MLANRAEPSGTLALGEVTDRGLANATGFIRPSVNLQLQLKIPRRPIFTYKIAQGCSPAFNGVGQNLADTIRQLEVTLTGYASCYTAWVYPGEEQRCAGVNIAHADNDVSIHNERLHIHCA